MKDKMWGKKEKVNPQEEKVSILLSRLEREKETVKISQKRLKEVNNILEEVKQKYNINKEQGTLTQAQAVYVEELIKATEFFKRHEEYFKIEVFAIKNWILTKYGSSCSKQAYQMGFKNNYQYLTYLNAEMLDFIKSIKDEELTKKLEEAISSQGHDPHEERLKEFLRYANDSEYFSPIKNERYERLDFGLDLKNTSWSYESFSKLFEIDQVEDDFENEKPKSR